MIIGYTTGVFDLFHVGHLNLLKNAKSLCDKLVVGVSTDDLVEYKGKRSVIPFEERKEMKHTIGQKVEKVSIQEKLKDAEERVNKQSPSKASKAHVLE